MSKLLLSILKTKSKVKRKVTWSTHKTPSYADRKLHTSTAIARATATATTTTTTTATTTATTTVTTAVTTADTTADTTTATATVQALAMDTTTAAGTLSLRNLKSNGKDFFIVQRLQKEWYSFLKC